MDSLTEVPQAPEVQKLAKHFPEADQNACKAFDRPLVMIEMAWRSLHYKDRHKAGELCLNKSIFFPGWVMTGCAPTMSGNCTEGSREDQTTIAKKMRAVTSESFHLHVNGTRCTKEAGQDPRTLHMKHRCQDTQKSISQTGPEGILRKANTIPGMELARQDACTKC